MEWLSEWKLEENGKFSAEGDDLWRDEWRAAAEVESVYLEGARLKFASALFDEWAWREEQENWSK